MMARGMCGHLRMDWCSDGVFSGWNRSENWNGLEIGVMIVDEWGQN